MEDVLWVEASSRVSGRGRWGQGRALGLDILWAQVDERLCALYLNTTQAVLGAYLHRRYPEVVFEQKPAFPRDLEAFFHSGHKPKLLLKASAFERRVWTALIALSAEDRPTYGEIAAQIGAPTAARAVGSAVGRNPVALVVPCHQVIGAKGSLGGYAWGVELKRQLLEGVSP